MRRGLLLLIVLVIGGLWFITGPETLAEDDLPAHTADVEHGRTVFFAGGCASCHATPDQDDPLRLGGGAELDTPFGVFHVPNLSPHPEAGVGGWTTVQFVNAMVNGVSPDGEHYYPAFPYTSYRSARLEDLIDLKAFLDTLESVAGEPAAHDVNFPYNLRRGIGLWKLRYLGEQGFTLDPGLSEAENRGAYLATALGHCSECHTPRDTFGGLDASRWLAGGPSPVGEGGIPNITPHEDGIGDWSESDIAYLLETGFEPDFDSVGGPMAAVVRNMAQLTAADRNAIAAYLKTVPPVPDPENPEEAEEPAPEE